MLERLRDGVANGFAMLAQRFVTEGRWPQHGRVPYSGRTAAGILATPDSAVTIPAVWACLRYLSQTTAVLPWHVLRDGKTGGELMPSHPVDWLLWKRPSAEWSSFQFRETLMHWALRWGNGYAEIERDQLGRPFALWPIHPDRVVACRDPETQNLFYEVRNGSAGGAAGSIELQPEDMFHLRGFGEGPVGVNVIHYAAESIGWARAVQLFGASFFGNGMNVSGVVINKKPLKPGGLARQKAEFAQLYQGPRRANRTAFLDNDASFQPVAVEPDKAQFILTNQFLVQEICRWFGVPPHKVAMLERATFANIESQAIEVVVDSISPWAKRFEDEADFKLFGQNRQSLYTKMNLNALMRGDSASRGAWYKMMREAGVYSANDILRLEDQNTIGTDGDKRVMQSQYTTLDRLGEAPSQLVEPEPEAAPEKPTDPIDPEDPAPGGPNGRAEAAAIAALLDLDAEMVA